VKYLGEEGAATPVGAAAAVCSPWDLVVCPDLQSPEGNR
jgi:predicted alpha/beta-fold hydrolase